MSEEKIEEIQEPEDDAQAIVNQAAVNEIIRQRDGAQARNAELASQVTARDLAIRKMKKQLDALQKRYDKLEEEHHKLQAKDVVEGAKE